MFPPQNILWISAILLNRSVLNPTNQCQCQYLIPTYASFGAAAPNPSNLMFFIKTVLAMGFSSSFVSASCPSPSNFQQIYFLKRNILGILSKKKCYVSFNFDSKLNRIRINNQMKSICSIGKKNSLQYFLLECFLETFNNARYKTRTQQVIVFAQ